MTSLTRDEARARAAAMNVQSYDVQLDLTQGERRFGSRTAIRFRYREPGEPTFVDVAAHEVRSVTLNGDPLEPAAEGNRLWFTPVQPQNEIVVDAVMSYSHDGEGLHRHVDPADGRTYLYAMSFLDAAPRWLACFDQPDLKAPVRFDVRCPEGWTVAGNGPATEVEPGHWRLTSHGPLATYFMTLVAGPYYQLRDEHDGIPLVLHVRQSLADHLDREAAEMFATTKHSFDELHRLFGVRYPWGEYHQAFVPEFNAGAMENPGCVTLRDQYVFRSKVTDAERLDREITIAHEMAHQWFGDLVTMRWWDDLWLNESFAEYLGHVVLGEHAWLDFGAARKPWGFAADRRPSTHPVAGNGAPDAASALNDFDGISYAKGASALRQLALYVGDDVFLGGLRAYIDRYADRNAELADLLAAWGEAGASDIDAWSRAWLRTTGLDALSVSDGSLVRTADGSTPRPHSIAVAALGPDGAERGRLRVAVTADRTPLDGLSGSLLLPDAADESWAKLVLPAESWTRLPTLFPGVTDTSSRIAIWNALQLAVADAELDPAVALDIVTSALPADTDDNVWARVGRWAARNLARTYVPDAGRAEALARLATTALNGVAASPTGSARQLAAARVAISTSVDAGLLRGWLDADSTAEGLVVDTELRWSVYERLALLGDLDAGEIDAAAVADRSSAGAVHAARCRASRPDPAAKAAAWELMLRDPDVPNYELYALAEGFWDPDQREFTAPYVDRYFAEIPATAALRSGWVVDRLALLAYPWPDVTPETVAATERLLEEPDLHPGLRRSVVDAGDDLRRAVAVRVRFGRS